MVQAAGVQTNHKRALLPADEVYFPKGIEGLTCVSFAHSSLVLQLLQRKQALFPKK